MRGLAWVAGCAVLAAALCVGGWWAWTDLTQQQQAVREELAATQREMEFLDGRLAELEGAMSAGGRDVADLVEGLQTQINDLEGKTFGFSGHSFGDPTISDLDSQVDDLEARIGTLEHDAQLGASSDPVLQSRIQQLESDVQGLCFSLRRAGVSVFC